MHRRPCLLPLAVQLRKLLLISAAPVLVLGAVPPVEAQLVPSTGAQTVYDSHLHVTWLANANLAGTPDGQFGVGGINPSGTMSYATAQAWVGALNANTFLGHQNWTLPTNPPDDPTCSIRGPHDQRFGVGCSGSALGNLYSDPEAVDLKYPATAAPIPANTVGPFTNFQPYLYWSATSAGNKGWDSFSFATGFQGANTDNHVMYVLPMFDGPPPGTDDAPCAAQTTCSLEPTADGTLVYDPVLGVTWLADANFAATNSVLCSACTIDADGSMTHTSAVAFLEAMRHYNADAGWLGVHTWRLPPTLAQDLTCSLGRNTQTTFGFDCKGSAMGELYYTQLLGGLTAGTPVVGPVQDSVGPFTNVQPYLYWACQQSSTDTAVCGGEPAANFQWSFSFGNGFEGTDVVQNQLYVMVYYPDPGAHPLPAPSECRGGAPGVPHPCM